MDRVYDLQLKSSVHFGQLDNLMLIIRVFQGLAGLCRVGNSQEVPDADLHTIRNLKKGLRYTSHGKNICDLIQGIYKLQLNNWTQHALKSIFLILWNPSHDNLTPLFSMIDA